MHFRKLFPVVVLVALLFPAMNLQAEETLYGTASVKSRPSGGVVFIDGVQVGVTPCTVADVTIGTHRVVIRMDGYKLYAGNLTVSAGQKTPLRAELEPEASEETVESGKRKIQGIVKSTYFDEMRYYAGYTWSFGNYKSNDFNLGLVRKRLNLELDYLTPAGAIDCGGNFLPSRDRNDIWKHYHELKHAVTGRVGLVVGQSKQVSLITQLGYTNSTVKGFKCKYGTDPRSDDYATSHIKSGLVGFRLDYMCTKWLSLSGITELNFRLGQDEFIDDIIEKASVSMNDWATGLRFKVGLGIVL